MSPIDGLLWAGAICVVLIGFAIAVGVFVSVLNGANTSECLARVDVLEAECTRCLAEVDRRQAEDDAKAGPLFPGDPDRSSL